MTTSRRIKLKDIAEKTGYTVGTISKALQGRDGIAAETRETIEKAAREIGYIANAQAGGLRSGSSKTVAIIVSDIANPLFSILIKNIISQLDALGYSAILMDTEEKSVKEEKAVISALGKNVDGILLCPTQLSDRSIELMKQNGMPFVLMGRRFEKIDADCVVWNDRHGAYLATKHLLELGHRDIVMLTGYSHISSAKERYLGYCDALREADMPVRNENIFEINIATHETAKTIQWLLDTGASFSAMLCFSDYVAWEAIAILNQRGLRVPEDVSVVGFDDIQSQMYFPYPLTTVHVPKTLTARRAVDLLMDILEHGPLKRRQIMLNTDLIVRGTTSRPR